MSGNNGNSNKNVGGGQGAVPGIWDQIEKLIGDKLSQNPMGQAASQFMQQQEWVQDIVKKALSSAVPGVLRQSTSAQGGQQQSSAAAKRAENVSMEVFETHQQVIAKFKLPPKQNPRAIQVMVRSDQIKLMGLPGGEPTFIGLPAPVIAKSARARFREGVLEVYARKQKRGTYHEAYVEY